MVIVSFEGNEVTYTRQDLNQITLAYCCSIHKSQGSEFPIVILPVVKSYFRMLRRNLLYTAITRSRNALILCGEEQALRIGVEREEDVQRLTTLFYKLKGLDLKMNHSVDAEPDNKLEEMLQADPMIGMENVTPYDFL